RITIAIDFNTVSPRLRGLSSMGTMTNDPQEGEKKTKGKGRGERGRLGRRESSIRRNVCVLPFLPFIISVMMRTHEELSSPLSLCPITLTEWRKGEKNQRTPNNKCKSE